jgi:transcription elongation GreA/GreB family factor
MRQFMTALALVAACSMAAVTTTGAQAKPAAKTAAKTAAVATHSTTGTVKSIDSNTLVISKPGKKGSDMTFTVNGSTQKDGTVGVGSNVTVRYQNEGKTMVATAISERAAKQMASTKPASTSKPATKK